MRLQLQLFLLIAVLAILLSIADAGSKNKTPKKTVKTTLKTKPTSTTNSRNARQYFRDAVAVPVVMDDTSDEDEADDEVDDDDDQDDDLDLDDDSGFGGYGIPDFNELFPNPHNFPVGPNSYGRLPQQPQAQQQQQQQGQKQQQQTPYSPVRRAEPAPVYADDDVPPPRRGNKSRPPPPQRGNYPPPPQSGNYPPPPRNGHYVQEHPQQQFDGPPPRHGYPSYSLSGGLSGEARPIFDYFSKPKQVYQEAPNYHQQAPPPRHRAELPDNLSEEEERDGPLSRTLLESNEVTTDDVPEKSERASAVVPQTQQFYGRHGYKTTVRPGFGTNRYYTAKTQDTRYFRPITNRIYTDYVYSPQGSFGMRNYRPSYRPRVETGLENVPVISRRAGYYHVPQSQVPAYYYVPQVPLAPERRHQGARFYSFRRSPLQDQYNPEYVVNPTEMLSRRKFRYHPSQKMPSPTIPLYSGEWGNPRQRYINPHSGAQYHSSYLGSRFL